MRFAKRGDIYYVDFDPTEGHEQSGRRPAVIVSSDAIDLNIVEMAIVIPGTRTKKYHPITGKLLPDVVEIAPSKQNGLPEPTFFLCSQLRSVSVKRFDRRIGNLTSAQLYDIEEILILLLDLGPKD